MTTTQIIGLVVVAVVLLVGLLGPAVLLHYENKLISELHPDDYQAMFGKEKK